MKVKDVINARERFAPLPLQEEYDNAGLHLGLKDVEVSGALLCLDVTEDVLAEAVTLGCNMVISHHPLLFRALKNITDATLSERCVRYALKHDLIIYSAHTNLDNAEGGVNAEAARHLGLKDIQFLQSNASGGGSGIFGVLDKPMKSIDFLQQVKSEFGVECLQHNQLLSRPIHRVAFCGGAGDFLLNKAIAMGADAFITGEMHYHLYFGHEERIQIAVLGHYQSEQFTSQLLQRILKEALPQLKTHLTQLSTNPIHYL